MSKVAVILADGFEEIEAIAPIDILRRAGIEVDTYGLKAEVTGSHQITIKADFVLTEAISDYDLIMLPGGMPGSANLRENDLVIESLQQMDRLGKKIAAICAAPIVLEKAGLLVSKKFTHFPGIESELKNGFDQKEAVVVVDGNLITARGAGVALEFGYQLLDAIGKDSLKIRESMQYDYLFK